MWFNWGLRVMVKVIYWGPIPLKNVKIREESSIGCPTVANSFAMILWYFDVLFYGLIAFSYVVNYVLKFYNSWSYSWGKRICKSLPSLFGGDFAQDAWKN